MKYDNLACIVGGIIAVAALTFAFLTERQKDNVIVPQNEVEYAHDWECRFIIVDGYNGHGQDLQHYVNDYKRNTDHSITFVGEDGLLTTIPYPYFQIIPNPNPQKEKEL
jgi:hypothetical protein